MRYLLTYDQSSLMKSNNSYFYISMTYFDSDWKSAVYLSRCSEVSADSVVFFKQRNILLLSIYIPINF